MVAITADDLTRLTQAAAQTDFGAGKLGVAIRADRAGLYAPALEAARSIADLQTPLRVRHFIAQIAHETGSFGSLVESTRYTNADHLLATFRKEVKTLDQAKALVAQGAVKIADFVYANRLGNGSEASGDGFNYRGRGFMMITGKANYADVQAYSGLQTVSQPDLLGDPTTAAQAAAHFWAKRNINALADKNDSDGVTLIVNGGLNGAPQRKAWLTLAEAVWPDG
jgi:putative chitinase